MSAAWVLLALRCFFGQPLLSTQNIARKTGNAGLSNAVSRVAGKREGERLSLLYELWTNREKGALA